MLRAPRLPDPTLTPADGAEASDRTARVIRTLTQTAATMRHLAGVAWARGDADTARRFDGHARATDARRAGVDRDPAAAFRELADRATGDGDWDLASSYEERAIVAEHERALAKVD